MSSCFYPLRAWRSRSELRQVLPELTALGDKLTPRAAGDVAGRAVYDKLQAEGVNLRTPAGSVAMSQETQGVLVWGEWALSGKRIIDCSEELAQAFCRSDCGDMRMSDLEVPYHCMYLRFPLAQEDAITYSGDRVAFEGAYIVHSPRYSTRIVLCGRPLVELPAAERWLERYDLRIKSEHFDKPAQDAITLALADDLEDLRSHLATARAGKIATAAVEESFQILIRRMEDDHPAYEKALRLVLNALAYMQFGDDQEAPAWPAEAPPKLVKQVLDGTPKERERGNGKLWALGHVPIIKLGGNFTRQFRHPATGVRAHWRQGHWRRQAHGVQMALRKLIWIFPTVVGAKAET